MVKKTTIALVFGLLAMSLSPANAFSHYYGGVAPVWERTGEFLSSPFVAAFDPAHSLYRPPVYPYPPDVPPGLCRWERFVLDRNGQYVLDRNGQPVKEYTIGPCHRPPY
jgi:hypothetical protein